MNGVFKWHCSKCRPLVDLVEKQNTKICKIEAQFVGLTSDTAQSESHFATNGTKNFIDSVGKCKEHKLNLGLIQIERNLNDHMNEFKKDDSPGKHSLLLKPADASSNHYAEETWRNVKACCNVNRTRDLQSI